MPPFTLRFRQIHLDFHTSEMITDIGARFDPEQFAATLESAHVNSVTCFARCHHGWMYYDTKAFPERRHPHLARNLLEEQIAACHARNIRVPIYTTVEWDHYTANEHPEWLCTDDKGAPLGTPIFEAGFYRQLCLNSPYREFLKAHTRELLETLPCDGFFFDIMLTPVCACRYCRAAMEAKGLDPTNAAVRAAFGVETVAGFQRELSRLVRSYSQDCSIFYNAGHIGPRQRAIADTYSHFELESLPSGGWGYAHFPLTMRYARTLALDCLGMTGKFHTTWGDFHSLKSPQALQFECFQMLALGAKCSIGDQLHPSGKIDPHVYQLVGSVYSEVEKKEPWCEGATALTEIGVLSPEQFVGGRQPDAAVGAVRLLESSGYQFDVIDTDSDFQRYRTLVLPDVITVTPVLAQRLRRYLDSGGALIATFESGLNPEKTAFALDGLGVTLRPNPTRDAAGQLVRGRVFPSHDYVDYILPGGEIGKGLPETEHVMYIRGTEVDALPGTEVLVRGVLPHFDRTYQHFFSHRQTPSSGRPGLPGIVRRGRAIYFAHPIFTQYCQNAPRWCKTLLLNALAMLLPEPLVRHSGPATLRVTLNEQAAHGRWVLHALHYIPERRSKDMDIMEDVIPLYDISFSVQVERKKATGVTCVPGGAALPFEQKGGRLSFVLPRLDGHQMVEIKF